MNQNELFGVGMSMGAFGSPTPPDVFFGNFGKEFENLNNGCMNDITYYSYLFRLCNMYMSVFEWKNLPEGCDERMLEWWLMFNGYVGFIYDEVLEAAAPEEAPEGYAIMQLLLQGQMGMYQLPKERSAYSVDAQVGLVQNLDAMNSVIIFDQQIRVTPWPTLCMYASRLANIERSIDVNVTQQKTPCIIKCNEKQKLSLMNLMNQAAANNMYIWADDKLDLSTVEALNTGAPMVSTDLEILKHQYWNEVLTFIGVENTNTDKKERQVSAEVLSNMGDVEANRFTRLTPREKAADQMNAILEKNGWFDDPEHLPVEVSFRSGMYIRTDKEGAVPTEGMEAAEVEGQGNSGYGKDTLWKKLKNALKGVGR